MTKYCEIEDVIVYLPNNIIVEGANSTPDPYNPEPSNLVIENIDFYIEQATQRINALIGSVYDVPLKKTNQGGTVAFPSPIPAVCAILAAQMIYEQKLMGADRETSEAQKRREDFAEGMMVRLQNGEIVLEGQRRTRSSRFVSNNLRGAPKNPAVEGRSQGNK
jgi:hypothetical protein